MQGTQYGQPFLLSGLNAGDQASALGAMPYSDTSKLAGAAYTEKWLQDLIAAHPEILPFYEIGEPAFAQATSVCLELPVDGKYVDNLLVTDRGYLILIECKLWRNPEARRSVIGQILDYATVMSRWDYATLDQAVRKARPAPGLSRDASLWERAGSSESLKQRDFIDAVSRNLKRGRFLLLVVGDGIRQGIETIAEFLQGHAGLHFTLGLAEMSLYRLPDGKYIAQPRVVARTEMVERGIVTLMDERIEVRPPDTATSLRSESGRLRPTKTISEGEMLQLLETKEAGLGAKLQAFFRSGEAIGISKELTATAIRVVGPVNDDIWPLAMIDPKNGSVWFDSMVRHAKSYGRTEEAMQLYARLVALLDDPRLRQEKMAPGTKSGVRSLPLSELLRKPDQLISAFADHLHVVGTGRMVDQGPQTLTDR